MLKIIKRDLIPTIYFSSEKYGACINKLRLDSRKLKYKYFARAVSKLGLKTSKMKNIVVAFVLCLISNLWNTKFLTLGYVNFYILGLKQSTV